LFVIVTVAMVMLLSVMFLGGVSVRHGEAEQRPVVPVWAIGLRLSALALVAGVLTSILFLIWRIFAWLGSADPAGAAVNPEERRRILGMVEQGKMTGAEGAELLDAMGKSSALRGQQTFGRLDIAILAAFLVTVLGFLLPWVQNSINVAKINAGLMAPAADVVVSAAGYETGPVGWIVLVSACLGVLLVFITPRDYLYKFALLQMLCFSVALAGVISVWWRVGTDVMSGVIVCVIGLACAIVASGMKLRALGR
jgi:hypothetical protein